MKIGIYGGTFDPPHRGHTEAAASAVKALGLDRLIVIPTFTPPHKELADMTAGASARLHMVRLAMNSVPETEVSSIEIDRGGKSYTADTVKTLRELYPNDELYLIIGSDMVESFRHWRNTDEIISRVTIAALSRTGDDNDHIMYLLDALSRELGAKTAYIPNDAIVISSAELRVLLPQRKGRECLSDSVYSYIISHRLYGARPDFSWLREKAYSMLKPNRVPHVRGCEEEAVRLAERWGADTDSAREAAILHDITKKEDVARQLILCEEYGIITDAEEKGSSALMHALTASKIAEKVFGCSPDVCSAIKWHTTGRENMTLLDKIIYLADYIEPTRDFPGVQLIRATSYEDIDRALLLGYEMSLADMKERGITPHPRTVRAMESVRDMIEE